MLSGDWLKSSAKSLTDRTYAFEWQERQPSSVAREAMSSDLQRKLYQLKFD